MVSTRSGAGKKSPKSSVKPQPSKVKKSKKAAPKPKKATKKKTNANKSSASKDKKVSWEETETEYSDENDDIISPYAAGKHRSPTSYKAPKGSRRYSGNSKLVNDKGTYSGVRPKSSPGLGRQPFLSDDEHDDVDDFEEWTGFGDVGPAPATVHNNRSMEMRMEMELKASELCRDLQSVVKKLLDEGSKHESFNMIAKHLRLAVDILVDMRAFPGSWPEGPAPIPRSVWRNKIQDALEHIQRDRTYPESASNALLHGDPLWPGTRALSQRFGLDTTRPNLRARVGSADDDNEPVMFELSGPLPDEGRREPVYGPPPPARKSKSLRDLDFVDWEKVPKSLRDSVDWEKVRLAPPVSSFDFSY